MKIKVLYLGLEEKVTLDNVKGCFLQNLSEDRRLENVKSFYRVNDYIFEYINLVKDEVNISNIINRYNNKDVLILNKLNRKVLDVLRAFYNTDINPIIISGDKNIVNNLEDLNIYLNKIIYLPQLSCDNSEVIDMNLIFMIIANNELGLRDIIGTSLIIGYGKNKNASGEIALSILKEFGHIQKNKEFYLNIYCREELDLQELTYIEDPIREYMIENSQIVIRQLINNTLGKTVYFSLSAK